MEILHTTWEYLRKRQPPVVRFLHIVIVCLVLSQILVSSFMEFTGNGEVSGIALEYCGTWMHISNR